METRSMVCKKINDIISNSAKAKNIEISIYNWTLNQVERKQETLNDYKRYNSKLNDSDLKVYKSWDNKWFKKLYMTKARSIVFNLKDSSNIQFKESILNGTIKTKDIANMSSYEIKPQIWNTSDEEHKQKLGLFLKLRYLNGYVCKNENIEVSEEKDGMYQCEKCGHRKIDLFQLQTRSADEPMTIFFTCRKCEYKWKDDGTD